jgi:hypothetical protein
MTLIFSLKADFMVVPIWQPMDFHWYLMDINSLHKEALESHGDCFVTLHAFTSFWWLYINFLCFGSISLSFI